MPLVTIYCVQPFWRAGPDKLAHGALQQYEKPCRAMKAGEAAARRVGGAIVYSVEGDPDFESWGSPRPLAHYGEVPDVSF